MKNILIIFLLCITSLSFPVNDWRIIDPANFSYSKSLNDNPPFAHWTSRNVSYQIESAPAGLSSLITASFTTWDNLSTNLNFISGSNIKFRVDSGTNPWFGATFPTINSSTGHIVGMIIYLNTGTYPDGGKIFLMQWTNGTESVDFDRVDGSTQYCDVQNCATHEIGHALGIHHHSTGVGEPTMAERWRCPDFNTTLKRRTLQSEDRLAFEFLYALKSGSMKINQNWWDSPHNLSGNINILSGITLNIKSSASINLNNYSIQCTGTGKIVNEGTISGTKFYAKSGTDYKGYYPAANTLQQVLNLATSGWTVCTAPTTNTLSGNTIVPANITLYLSSGSTLYLNGYTVTTESGTISPSSSAVIVPDIRLKNSSIVKGFYPTIASANSVIPASGSGLTIFLGSGSFNEDVTMKSDCSLSGKNTSSSFLTGDVIINNKDDINISSLTIYGDIIVDYGSEININGMKARGTIDIAISSDIDIQSVTTDMSGYFELYQTYLDISECTSYNEVNNGFTAYEADYNIWDCSFYNKTRAFYNIARADGIMNGMTLCNNTWDIYCGTGSTAEFWIGELSSCSPPPIYGNVTLVYPCASCEGMEKSSPDGLFQEYTLPLEGADSSPEGLEYAELRNQYRAIQAAMRQDRKDSVRYDISKYAPKYNQVITGMKAFVAKYPDTDYAQQALKFIDYSSRALNQQDDFAAYLTALGKDAKYKSLQTTIKSQFIPWYLEKGEYQTALNLTDEVMKAQTDPENALYYLYRQGVIYHKYLKDAAKAEAIYKQVIDTDPNSAMAFSAGVRLGKLGKVYEGENKPSTEEPEVKFAIRNHPNPFNPVTNIQFDLPAADHVTLKVYDITGREVITLVDALQGSGSHTIMWNSQDKFGQRVASGMYFYRIEYRGQVLTNKMILMR